MILIHIALVSWLVALAAILLVKCIGTPAPPSYISFPILFALFGGLVTSTVCSVWYLVNVLTSL